MAVTKYFVPYLFISLSKTSDSYSNMTRVAYGADAGRRTCQPQVASDHIVRAYFSQKDLRTLRVAINRLLVRIETPERSTETKLHGFMRLTSHLRHTLKVFTRMHRTDLYKLYQSSVSIVIWSFTTWSMPVCQGHATWSCKTIITVSFIQVSQ